MKLFGRKELHNLNELINRVSNTIIEEIEINLLLKNKFLSNIGVLISLGKVIDKITIL